MASRPEVELTDATHLSQDVTDATFRATNLVAVDHADLYLYLHMDNDTPIDSMQLFKSIDGGTTWSSIDLEDTPGTNKADATVWWESWTPTTDSTGFKTGTKVHQFWLDIGGADAMYTWQDTSDDSWRSGSDHGLIHPSTFVNILRFQGATSRPQIFETSDGDLHVVACDDGTITAPQHWRSTDGGDTWGFVVDAATGPFVNAVSQDEVGAIPIGDNKIFFFWHDFTADIIYYQIWDNDTDLWLHYLLVASQDETNYDNSPTTEGTFAGGSSYAATDTVTMSDGTVITVDAVDGGGAVTQFTVPATVGTIPFAPGDTLTQSSTSGSGTGFTMTPDTDNRIRTAVQISTGYSQGGNTTGACYDLMWIPKNGSCCRLVVSQDETNYDNSPTTEGTFAGGTGYAASDTITLNDGTVVTVDAVSAGVVTQFSIPATVGTSYFQSGNTLTQSSTSGSGTGFTLTPDSDNYVALEIVCLSIAVDPINQASGNDLDFWTYDIATDTWTQKTNIANFSDYGAANDALGDNAMTYAYDNGGRLWVTYFNGDADGGVLQVKYKYTEDFGGTWSTEGDINSTADHLLRMATTRYADSADGSVTVHYGNDDTNRWYITNVEVYYPYPITTDFEAILYAGLDTDWTIGVDGPGSKGLEIFNGGVGFKWQDGDVANYIVYMDLNTPFTSVDLSGKKALFAIESIKPSAIETLANGGGYARLIDGSGGYNEYNLFGSDSLAGGDETVSLAGDKTPDRYGTSGAGPTFRAFSVDSAASASSLTSLAKPTGLADGDTVTLFAISDDGTNSISSWPSGFTEVADNADNTGDGRHSAIAYKYITSAAGEPANYTVSYTNTAKLKATAIAYSAGDSVVLDLTYNNTNHHAFIENTPETTGPSVSGWSSYNALALHLSAPSGTAITAGAPPTGYTERVDDVTNGAIYVAEKLLTTPFGPTETPDGVTWTGEAGTEELHHYTLVLSPNRDFDNTDVVDIRFGSKVSSVEEKDDPVWVFKSMTVGSFINLRGGTALAKMDYDDVRAWSAFFGLGIFLREGNTFKCFAKLFFNDTTGEYDLYFEDSRKTVTFPFSGVGDDFTEMTFRGHASTVTNVIHGQVIGSGATSVGYAGCLFDSGPDRVGQQDKANFNILDDNVDVVAFYACIFRQGKLINFGNTANPLSNIDLRVVDCGFDVYDNINRRVTSSALLWLRNQIVGEPTAGIGLTLLDDPAVDLDNLSVYNAYYGVKHTTPLATVYDGTKHASNTYDILNSGDADTITAGSFVTGEGYKILTVGTTDFTLIGAADNNIGTKFVATGAGSGTGTATEVLVISKTNGANPTTYLNTGTNSDILILGSVPVQVTVLDDSTGLGIQYAHVQIYLTSDYSTVVLSGETNASGIISGSFSGSTPAGIEGWAREMDITGTDYEPGDISGEIGTSGFSTILRLKPRNY